MSRTGDGGEPRAASGFVDEQLRAELPGLRLKWVTVAGARRSSPPELIARLRQLSDRFRGAGVIAMRTHPIPHAYRAFFRQIGLDPDVDRVPSEEVAVRRLLHGELRSGGALADALMIALVETGVPVWAIDADLVDPGGLGIRVTNDGDQFGDGDGAYPLGPARLVVADAMRIHGLLFGELAPGHAATARTRRIALFSIGVEGVPAIHVEEALWVCMEALGRV